MQGAAGDTAGVGLLTREVLGRGQDQGDGGGIEIELLAEESAIDRLVTDKRISNRRETVVQI